MTTSARTWPATARARGVYGTVVEVYELYRKGPGVVFAEMTSRDPLERRFIRAADLVAFRRKRSQYLEARARARGLSALLDLRRR